MRPGWRSDDQAHSWWLFQRRTGIENRAPCAWPAVTTFSAFLSGITLSIASLLLIGGRLADDQGRKRAFVAGLAVFLAAPVGCAAAPGPAALIAGRVLQGTGTAAVLASSLGLVAAAFPSGSARTHAAELWGAMIGGGVRSGRWQALCRWRGLGAAPTSQWRSPAASSSWLPCRRRGSPGRRRRGGWTFPVRPHSASAWFQLKRTQHGLRLAIDAALRPIELTTPRYAVLDGLGQAAELSGAELARRAFVTPQTMRADGGGRRAVTPAWAGQNPSARKLSFHTVGLVATRMDPITQ